MVLWELWERLMMRRDDPSGGKMRLRTGHQSRGWRKRWGSAVEKDMSSLKRKMKKDNDQKDKSSEKQRMVMLKRI